uniref:Isoform 6 of Peroxisomal biogenesis factor 19 n=1 Tax=Homo sapiens TaxID=9606 RepID=P40855-6|nr:peroxisomal biogenesis factor 19 isoform 2 [Homo sapiens]
MAAAEEGCSVGAEADRELEELLERCPLRFPREVFPGTIRQ